MNNIKTLKTTRVSSASKCPHVIWNKVISFNTACKYLGTTIDCKTFFPKTYRICDGENRKTKQFDKQISSLCSKEESGKLLQVKYKSNHSLWYLYIWLLQQKPLESPIISSQRNSGDDLLQVQTRSLWRYFYFEWNFNGVWIARVRTTQISNTIYKPKSRQSIFIRSFLPLRKFSKIDSAVSLKSAQGYCTEIETYEAVD